MIPLDRFWVGFILYSFFFTLFFFRDIPGKGQWRQKGLVTGFLIALYTEMWGFPLSLFIIASLVGQSQLPYQFDNLLYYFTTTRETGNLAFVNPSLVFRITYIIARGLAVLAVVIIIYGWYSLKKDLKQGLVTEGAYQYSRNPQYLGFMLFIVSMMLYWPTLLTVPMGVILCLMYYYLVRKEEKQNYGAFGSKYQRYASKVPRFLGRNGYKLLNVPKGMTLVEKVSSFALILPFVIWFFEAIVAWGFNFEELIRVYWFPIAFYFPVHIGLLIAGILLIVCVCIRTLFHSHFFNSLRSTFTE